MGTHSARVVGTQSTVGTQRAGGARSVDGWGAHNGRVGDTEDVHMVGLWFIGFNVSFIRLFLGLFKDGEPT